MTPDLARRADAPCPVCGKTGFSRNYGSGIGERMQKTGECFECDFWGQRCKSPQELVIDNYCYSIGSEPKPGERRSFLGMGGRRFDIEFFDGRKVTTHNLWAGGLIPERFRARIPNTAKFAGGASREKAGDITCWNASHE